MLTTILLIIILLLLIAIVAMMVTGWPGRERNEIEKTGNVLRREMAEHRAESIQLLHAIRIEVEDSVRESIEREMAGYGSKGGRSRSSRSSGSSKATSRSRSQQVDNIAISDNIHSVVEEDGSDNGVDIAIIETLQLPLFPQTPEPVRAVAPALAVAAPPAPKVEEEEFVPPPEVIRIGYLIDDIPDVE